MEVFEDELRTRGRVAARYSEGLRDVATPPHVAAGAVSVWAQYTLLFAEGKRDVVAARLREQGIPSAVYYSCPLHRQVAYQDFAVGWPELPASDELAGQVLSLPIHAYLEPSMQEHIIAVVRDA
jgi:dTDP-4-amino-4,6-dideoxygalactose transaminase